MSELLRDPLALMPSAYGYPQVTPRISPTSPPPRRRFPLSSQWRTSMLCSRRLPRASWLPSWSVIVTSHNCWVRP